MTKSKEETILTAAAAMASTSAMATDIKYIQRDIGEIKLNIKELSERYVTKDEFEPVKKIVYGLISVLGLATIAALLRLVILQ